MENYDILEDLDPNANKIKVDLISPNKFIVLSILTFGLYSVWWMYKSWKLFKEKDGLDIWPVARAIVTIIFVYPLFEEIRMFAISKGYTKSYSSGLLFMGFLVLNIFSKLPDPYWLISLLASLVFIQPVQAFNYAVNHSQNYYGEEPIGFNPRQIILIILGGIFTILVLLGLSAELMSI